MNRTCHLQDLKSMKKEGRTHPQDSCFLLFLFLSKLDLRVSNLRWNALLRKVSFAGVAPRFSCIIKCLILDQSYDCPSSWMMSRQSRSKSKVLCYCQSTKNQKYFKRTSYVHATTFRNVFSVMSEFIKMPHGQRNIFFDALPDTIYKLVSVSK